METDIQIIISSAIASFITGVFIGLGLSASMYFMFRKLIKEIKEDMPKWIKSYRNEALTTNALERVNETRGKY